MLWLRTWWNQPDQFDWVTGFLRQRGLLHPAQMIAAVIASSSTVVPASVLVSQRLPTPAALTINAVTATFALGMTIFLLTHWPTRQQSQIAVVIGVLFIAAFSLTEPTTALAAVACTACIVTGGYIAFFHSAKLLAFHTAVAVAIAAAVSLRLAREADITTAVGVFWLIGFSNASVSLGIRGISRTVRMYVERSEKDPLTGLLNRRGFIDVVTACLAQPSTTHTHLVVLMVDLDDFKQVNDTHGHAAGDRVLLEVAELLRHHLPPDAAISRAGGEEFLIALTSAASDATPIAARLCTAIAELPYQITASIGTSSSKLHRLSGPGSVGRIEQLIALADAAMYAAKRNGRNRAQHAWPEP